MREDLRELLVCSLILIFRVNTPGTIVAILGKSTTTPEQVQTVCNLFLSFLSLDLGHRLTEEKLARLQLVVGTDDDSRVHIEDHEVHHKDEHDENDSADLLVSLVHACVVDVAHKHLEAAQE